LKFILPQSLRNGLVLGLTISLAIAAVAWAGFTGPNRTTTATVREPDEDQWFCTRSGVPWTCWFAKAGDGGQRCDGSPPSTGSQTAVCGWIADNCGCNWGYTEETVSLPEATINGTASCDTPGNSGWCRGGAAIELSAAEPLTGEVIQVIEGNPGGVLCDPPDGSGVSCSWSGGGEGSFTVDFWAVSSYGDTSNMSSAAWRLDSGTPTLSLNVSGGTPGGGGWYRRGPVDVSVAGADGISGLASAQLSVDGGSWSGSAQISSDGVHDISARATDLAGNESNDSTVIRIDGSPPNVNAEILGKPGNGGWYLGPVTVEASASDGLSGVDSVEVSIDGGGWQAAPRTIAADGTHSVRARARDVAGNEATDVGPTIKIDAYPPESVFIDPPNGSETWVSGLVTLVGTSIDFASGLQSVEISFDSGQSWEALELRGLDWSTSWDTSGLTNGRYPVWARARDVAGHLESTAEVTLLVDNLPPFVDLQDSWPVEESGALTVEEADIGLAGVSIEIFDNQTRLLSREFTPGEIPAKVEWDGIAQDGAVAAPGSYAVTVVAWDLAGNRGSDTGFVIVPQPVLNDPEAPDPVVEQLVTAADGPVRLRSPSTTVETIPTSLGVWLWPALGWMGLMGAVAFAKLTDPRPRALRELRDEMKLVRGLLEE
jgi:hypothetical protein